MKGGIRLAVNQPRFQLPGLKRISIFIGAYGSGKSEVSVNFAFWLAASGQKVTLCDLDTINPFYRSADARAAVEAAGIRLVAPAYAGTNVEVPAVPGDVYSVFDDRTRMAVLDIGGEDLGARVIASLKNRLSSCEQETALYMVVNPYRPFTDSPENIESMARVLEAAAGQRINGLVHNANLLEPGDIELLNESWPILDEASKRLGVPVVFATAMESDVQQNLIPALPEDLPLLWLSRSILYPTA